MFATLMLWPAVTATPDNVKLPAPGMRGDRHCAQRIGRAVVRIGEAEVGRG